MFVFSGLPLHALHGLHGANGRREGKGKSLNAFLGGKKVILTTLLAPKNDAIC